MEPVYLVLQINSGTFLHCNIADLDVLSWNAIPVDSGYFGGSSTILRYRYV
jgi:hypothetical protein